jgi:hypothetical protein
MEVLEFAQPATLRLADQSIDRGFFAVRRSSLSLLAPLLREVHRVMKTEAQLAITLDFALSGQTRQTIVDACAAAGFQQIASRRRGLQRTIIFRA